MWFSDLTQSTQHLFEYEVKSFREFMQIVEFISVEKGKKQMVWRGFTQSNYSLCSSLDRYVYQKRTPKLNSDYNEAVKNLSSGVKKKGSTKFKTTLDEETLSRQKYIDELYAEWGFVKKHSDEPSRWAHQQHFGLPTPMIDVTWNPLIALWFAVSFIENNSDSRIICIDLDENKDNLIKFDPDNLDSRIMVQHGLFIRKNPNAKFNVSIPKEKVPLNSGKKYLNTMQMFSLSTIPIKFNLIKIKNSQLSVPQKTSNFTFNFKIPKKIKAEIRTILTSMGLTYAHLFPDLPGLSTYIQSQSPFDSEMLSYRIKNSDFFT